MSEGVNIDGSVQGDVIGAGFSGDNNVIAREYTVQGDVYHFHITAPEAAREARALDSLPTGVRPRGAGPATTDPSVQRTLDELLARVKELRDQGENPRQVEAGGVQLSRVDLLLKKAVLLVTEAEQTLDDSPEGRSLIERIKAGTVDLSQLQDDRMDDGDPYMVKLREAHALLTEARGLEPYNAEVLLNLAKVSGLLERPDEEGDLLELVLAQLDAPRTDVERLHRAQALFMMATHGDAMPDADRLRDARAQFAALGRTEWVRMVDENLQVADAAAPRGDAWAGAPGQMDAWGGGQDPGDVLGGLLASLGLGGAEQMAPQFGGSGGSGFDELGGFGAAAQPAPFAPAAGAQRDGTFPVGRWNVDIQNMGSMTLEMRPDGSLSGLQQGPGGIRFDGRWEWSPPRLGIHATMHGMSIFEVQMTVHEDAGGAVHGTSLDGERFRFVRA
jgi:hypothetical protein